MQVCGFFPIPFSHLWRISSVVQVRGSCLYCGFNGISDITIVIIEQAVMEFS